MNGDTFAIELGDRRWDLPRLPWRIVRIVQPSLLRQSRRLLGGDETTLMYRIDEKSLAEQTKMILLALQFIDPGLTQQNIDELPIGATQFALASVAVLRACGLSVETGQASSSIHEVQSGTTA